MLPGGQARSENDPLHFTCGATDDFNKMFSGFTWIKARLKGFGCSVLTPVTMHRVFPTLSNFAGPDWLLGS